jgi:hypothetical protein
MARGITRFLHVIEQMWFPKSSHVRTFLHACQQQEYITIIVIIIGGGRVELVEVEKLIWNSR